MGSTLREGGLPAAADGRAPPVPGDPGGAGAVGPRRDRRPPPPLPGAPQRHPRVVSEYPAKA